jgi:heme-degrading monooxygenase HmoA
MSKTFKPYYAVIFTSKQREDIDGYTEMADRMEELAKHQAGYLGMESAINDIGITVSYWESLVDIKHWKQQTEHLEAQEKGRNDLYNWYHVRICKVEREYKFQRKLK